MRNRFTRFELIVDEGGLGDNEQSAEQLQEVKHPKARIAHRGICAIPDVIFGSHRESEWPRSA